MQNGIFHNITVITCQSKKTKDHHNCIFDVTNLGFQIAVKVMMDLHYLIISRRMKKTNRQEIILTCRLILLALDLPKQSAELHFGSLVWS